MRFPNLRRLLPPHKVWRLFTHKLHKLRRSKAIKSSTNISHKHHRKGGWRRSLSIQPKKFKLRPKSQALAHPQKWAPPQVYVDRLFVEQLPSPANELKCRSSDLKTRSDSSKEGNIVMMDHDGDKNAADDLWESVVVASPLEEIDKRAEEFIARFRAQMRRENRPL